MYDIRHALLQYCRIHIHVGFILHYVALKCTQTVLCAGNTVQPNVYNYHSTPWFKRLTVRFCVFVFVCVC